MAISDGRWRLSSLTELGMSVAISSTSFVAVREAQFHSFTALSSVLALEVTTQQNDVSFMPCLACRPQLTELHPRWFALGGLMADSQYRTAASSSFLFSCTEFMSVV